MAKLFVTRNKDGTWRLRAQRNVGKELAAHKTVKSVKDGEVRQVAAALMAEVAPPKISRPKV